MKVNADICLLTLEVDFKNIVQLLDAPRGTSHMEETATEWAS